jgi:hypothetical protein
MSSALVPKPGDWANHIGTPNTSRSGDTWALTYYSQDVVGFYFLDLATGYQPADDLAAFLAAGEPPIYIGSVPTSCACLERSELGHWLVLDQ